MITDELREALDTCREAGLVVEAGRVTCRGCDDTWWMRSAPATPEPYVRWLRRFASEHRAHVPVRRTAQRFTVLVDPAPSDEQVTRLHTNFDDLGVGASPRRGIGWVAVDRPAEHLAGAIVSVVRDVEAVGLRVIRVDPDDAGEPPVLEAANVALLLRSLEEEVDDYEVIRQLVTP